MLSDADRRATIGITARNDKVMAKTPGKETRSVAHALAMALTLAAGVGVPRAGATAAEVLGGTAAACDAGADGNAALVTVQGFKDRRGRLRVQTYRGTPEEFLVSGRYLHRAETAVTPAGDMTLCLPLPGPGLYAIVALHDRDSNGKLSVWSDGVGFSRNPRLGLSKPAADATLINFSSALTPVRIVLNYRRGLSVRPLQ